MATLEQRSRLSKSSKHEITENLPQKIDRAKKDILHRIPPNNLEAEQAVLAGILMQNENFHLVVDMIGEEDFYSPAHRILFSVFLSLYRENLPIDPITVKNRLIDMKKLEEIGGDEYLNDLSYSMLEGANISYYANIVSEKSILRKLISECSSIITSCFELPLSFEKYDKSLVSNIVDKAEQSIFNISERKIGSKFKDSKSLLDNIFAQMTERMQNKSSVTGISTGYIKLDELTSGFQPSDLIILAARPSMGKTAFALNIATNIAVNSNVPIAFFSLEMSAEQLIMRMLCSIAHVDLTKVRIGHVKDEDWNSLYAASEKLGSAPIYIDDTPALTSLDIRARTRRLKAEKNVGIVAIDYLQLMSSNIQTDSREQEISHISRSLKALAKELEIPVLALSQLNRKVEDRSDKRPLLSDLRESGAIEQDADVIMFIYRDDVYNKKEDNPKKGTAEIIIGKQRSGPLGVVNLTFLPQFTSFEEPSLNDYGV